MWHIFEANNGNQLWGQVMSAFASDGVYEVPSSRDGPTRELLHVALTLRNPRERWITARQPALNIAFALAELVWILAGRSDAKFLTFFNRSLSRFVGEDSLLHGAYGDRLRRRFGLDQLDRAYHALSSNPNSRQIVLQIWDAEADLPNEDGLPRNRDIPCNTQSILKVRGNHLEWLQIMRSNDVFLGLPHNLIQFTFLQEVLAGWLKLEPGHYHHISDSLHLYERDATTVQIDSSKESLSSESFSLPKAESDRVFDLLARAVDQIIDEKNSPLTISKLPDQVDIPESYRAILYVLTAEGLRRRDHAQLADERMSACTSEVFRQMWLNWHARVRIQKKPL